MLPFHRRRERIREETVNENWEGTHPKNDSKGNRLGRFVVDWIKVSWRDVLAMAVLGAASQTVGIARQIVLRLT